MRKILSLAIAFSFLQFSFAEGIFSASSISQNGAAYLISQPQKEIIPVHTVQKKLPLKERLLLKLYQKKIQRHVSEEKKKRTVNLLGYLSIGASILSPLTFILLFAITSYGVVEALSVFAFLLLPLAIILGIISLHKRKKLADKTGTSKVPALIGILLSSILLLLYLVAIISFSIGFSVGFI